MTKQQLKLLLLSATLFLSSCATLTQDIEIKVYTDPDVNYDNYKTYAWTGSAQIVFDPIGQWEQPTLDTDEEVRFLVNRELRKHGLIPVEVQPDILVAFAAGIDTTVLELKENPRNKHIPTVAPKAALMIALIDADNGYVIWMGHATGEAQQQQSIENIRSRIDYAVSKIFDQL